MHRFLLQIAINLREYNLYKYKWWASTKNRTSYFNFSEFFLSSSFTTIAEHLTHVSTGEPREKNTHSITKRVCEREIHVKVFTWMTVSIEVKMRKCKCTLLFTIFSAAAACTKGECHENKKKSINYHWMYSD